MKPIVDGNDEIGESEPDWSTARLAGSVFKVPPRRRRPGCFLFKGNHQTICHLSFMGKQHKTSRHPYFTTFQYFSCIELMKSWFMIIPQYWSSVLALPSPKSAKPVSMRFLQLCVRSWGRVQAGKLVELAKGCGKMLWRQNLTWRTRQNLNVSYWNRLKNMKFIEFIEFTVYRIYIYIEIWMTSGCNVLRGDQISMLAPNQLIFGWW